MLGWLGLSLRLDPLFPICNLLIADKVRCQARRLYSRTVVSGRVNEIILRLSKEKRGLHPCGCVSRFYTEEPAGGFYAKEIRLVYKYHRFS